MIRWLLVCLVSVLILFPEHSRAGEAPPAVVRGALCIQANGSSVLPTNTLALIEATLLRCDGVQWVEREKVREVLQEQVLQSAMAPEQVSQRRQLGTLLRADLLVVIGPAAGAVPAVDVMICDTHQGLRLARDCFIVEGNGEGLVLSIGNLLETAVRRSKLRDSEIIAVYPFTSRDLTHDFDHLKQSYARLIEQTLIGRDSVALVELAEARRIGEEIALSSGKDIQRRLPLFVEGEFAHAGYAADAPVSVKLTLKRGETIIKEWSAKELVASEAAAQIQRQTDVLLSAVAGTAPVAPDAKADAKELARRAGVSYRLGFWEESHQLADASLLLNNAQPELHRDASWAIYRRLDSQMEKEKGAYREFWSQHLCEQREMMAHEEAFMRVRDVNMGGEILVHTGSEEIRPEACELFVRMMKLRYETKKHDGLYLYFTHYYQNAPPAAAKQVLEFKLQVARYWQEYMGYKGLVFEIVHQWKTADCPEVQEVIARLDAMDNPVCKLAAADMRKRLATTGSLEKDPDSRQYVPFAALTYYISGEVELKTFRLGIGEIAGWQQAGKGVELLWSREPGRLFTMKNAGKCQKVCDIVVDYAGEAACYDGRYVWAASANKERAEILVFDPATGQQWRSSPATLPPSPISRFTCTPFSPGRIAAVGRFGSLSDGRTWVGIFTFTPQSGIAFQLVHEAASIPSKNSIADWSQPDWSFYSRNACTLKGIDSQGRPHQLAIFDREGFPATVDPATSKFGLFQGWSTITRPVTLGELHDGAFYYTVLGNMKEGDRIMKLSLPGPTLQRVNQNVPSYGYLFFHKGKPHLFNREREIYRAEAIDKPFQKMELKWPKDILHVGWPKFAHSEFHGLVLYDEIRTGELHFSDD